jgi:ferredoxin
MFVAPNEPIPFKCVACGACVKTCPTGALSIQDLPEPLDKVFYRRHF